MKHSRPDQFAAPARPASGVRAKVARTNLSAGATPLVGRRGELDDLARLTARAALVSVVGPAGVGKTRLAQAHAVRALDAYMGLGGAWLVEVGQAASAGDVAVAIGAALDLDVDGSRPIASLAGELALRGPTLVVLDEATNSARFVAEIVERVSRTSRHARWLVTSRARLDAAGEAVLELGGLTLPIAGLDPRMADAVQLFVERARAARFGISLDDADTVVAIVRALGGNARAIEFAAARAKRATLAEILAEVSPPATPRASTPPSTPPVDLDGLPAEAVAVCARGTWFRPPGGPVVSVARWLALQNVLVRLAEHREIAAGAALGVDALVAAGWPGDRVLPKAGAMRVYTAVATLRRLGLRDVLLHRADGYLLDPARPIARVSAPASHPSSTTTPTR